MPSSVPIDSYAAHRPKLLGLAYRMLGDVGRAEDIVQDAWLRYARSAEPVERPRAFLVKVVTRLCLNELASARAQRESARGDRLPEPICAAAHGLDRLEALDQVSMALLVLLQRLTANERAVLLLHDVFDMGHAEIAAMLGKSEPACRQLLKRARDQVAEQRRTLSVAPQTHRTMLKAFLAAATTGDRAALEKLLAPDAVLVADAGPRGGSFGKARNLPGPLRGQRRIAAFVAAVTVQGSSGLQPREQELNGEPGIVVYDGDQPHSAIQLAIADGLIHGVFIHADPARLGHIGAVHPGIR